MKNLDTWRLTFDKNFKLQRRSVQNTLGVAKN